MSEQDIFHVQVLIAEKNIKGLQVKVPEKESEANSLSGNTYVNVIELILGSRVVATAVKGVFDIAKDYFKQKVHESDIEKEKIKGSEIVFSLKEKSGRNINLKFHSFDETERQRFFEAIDKVLDRDQTDLHT